MRTLVFSPVICAMPVDAVKALSKRSLLWLTHLNLKNLRHSNPHGMTLGRNYRSDPHKIEEVDREGTAVSWTCYRCLDKGESDL